MRDDGELLLLLRELSTVKREYDRIHDALRDVRECGYGIVLPSSEDLKLEELNIILKAMICIFLILEQYVMNLLIHL